MRNYLAFGLNISSEIEFPEFLPTAQSQADLEIKFGTVPTDLHGEKVTKNILSQTTTTEYLYQFPQIAKFHAKNGQTITIEPFADINQNSLRQLLLNTIFPAILYQKGFLLLRASAILTEKGAVLFGGTPKIGKSTLAMALKTRGYQVFTDDICVLKSNPNGETEVFPSYGGLILSQKGFELLKISNEEFQPIGKNSEKFFVPIPFDNQSAKIRQIYFLNQEANLSEVRVTPLMNQKKLIFTAHLAYRKMQIESFGLQIKNFQTMAALANKLPITLVSRPKKLNTINEIAEIIEKNLND